MYQVHTYCLVYLQSQICDYEFSQKSVETTKCTAKFTNSTALQHVFAQQKSH